MQISLRTEPPSDPILEAVHFLSFDNDEDICGYFIYSSVRRIGASMTNIEKAADRRFRALKRRTTWVRSICVGALVADKLWTLLTSRQ